MRCRLRARSGHAVGTAIRAKTAAEREPSGRSRALRYERAALPARNLAGEALGSGDCPHRRRGRCEAGAGRSRSAGKRQLRFQARVAAGEPHARNRRALTGAPARARTGAPRAVNGGSGSGTGRALTGRRSRSPRPLAPPPTDRPEATGRRRTLGRAARPAPPANHNGPAPKTRGAGFESGPVHAARRRGGGRGRVRQRRARWSRGGLARPAAEAAPALLAEPSPRGVPAPGAAGERLVRRAAPLPPSSGRRSGRRPGARVTHCLQTNASGPSSSRDRSAGAACARGPGERFLLLERPVAVGQAGSKEVDALVAKLGEVLQLSAQRAPPPPRVPKHLGPGSARDRAAPYSPRCCSGAGAGLLAPRGPAPPQAHSQHVEPPRPDRSGQQRVTKQLCGRGWLRSAARRRKQPPPGPGDGPAEEEDPHRLLQQLILSGNLIKEAVRRLQLAAAAAAAAASAASSGSASAGSGGADGEAAAAVQPLQ
ncbi:dapper homolog 3-like [Pyrgilauda ruficollis]|uniref:dapper homolog 3-like n=1 Tax=Pyrgilauda ruficollis TaxID=221976 RepID=UPI001B86EA9E|nr:dapper homolog 3-like [Pyrgilauda ruficollis]